MDESKLLNINKAAKTSPTLSPVKLHKVKGSIGQVDSGGEGEGESPPGGGDGMWSISRQEDCSAGPTTSASSFKELRISQSHSKKVIKHALRQQAKRRRKNTTIAAGNSAPLPRIMVPPQCEQEEVSNRINCRPPTMMEVLSSIPGFSIKQRKRSNKKLSAAAQLEQTKEGCIDLETPDSILVNTNLRSLLNKHTFNTLPPLYQYKLVQLLPHVDRNVAAADSFRLSASGLNNEFFARACLEWRERLAEGEFTPENQQKLKAEAEKEKSKLDPWKLKHFEPIWGESNVGIAPMVDWTPPPAAPPKAAKPTSKVKTPPPPPPPRLRTVGAVTRAVANYREKREAEENSMLLESNKRPKSSNKTTANIPTQPLVEPIPATVTSNSLQAEMDTKELDQDNRIKEKELDKEPLSHDGEFTDDQDSSSMKNICTDDAPEAEVAEHQTDPVEERDKDVKLDLSEWENVEVISVDPVQECVDANTQVEKDCEKVNDDSSLRLCDISASEDDVEPNKVDGQEAIAQEEQRSVFVTSIIETVDEGGSQDEECERRSLEKEEIFYSEPKSIILDEDNQSKSVMDNTDLTLDKDEQSSCESSEKIDVVPCESNQSNLEIVTNESCDKSKEHLDETCEDMDTRESFEDENQSLKGSECLDHIETNVTSQLSEPLSQCSNMGSSENNERFVEENLKPEENSNSEHPSVDDSPADKLSETGPEGNDVEERFDVDMADITENDPLDLVNDETSTDLPSSQPLSNNPDSQDSQPNFKEEPPGYAHTVKMEEELDIEDSGSNLQSQDSQDTRPEEPTSCPQQSLSDFEAVSQQVNMGVGESNGQAPFSIYSPTSMYPESLNEKEAAALFQAALNAVDSSTQELLDEVVLQEEREVNVIPMQEELEVRLEEIKPAEEWSNYNKMVAPHIQDDTQSKALSPPCPLYPGHVKLELEVTLTPEVDSQVSSTMEGGAAGGAHTSAAREDPSTQTSLTVIPPTTIVCLPSATLSQPMTVAQPGVVSSSAVPYLALTTSTPVRALPTKPKIDDTVSWSLHSGSVVSKRSSNPSTCGIHLIEKSPLHLSFIHSNS